jgi:hypothetical protein
MEMVVVVVAVVELVLERAMLASFACLACSIDSSQRKHFVNNGQNKLVFVH